MQRARRANLLTLTAIVLLAVGCGDEDPTPPKQEPQVPTHYAQLSAGGEYTCGLAVWGEAWCWGNNNSGKLGDGTTTSRSSPTSGGAGLRFSSIHAGLLHTCALTSTGKAYCWGTGTVGQLGTGTLTSSSTPVAVVGDLSFRALALGAFHTCGVTGQPPNPGRVHCWGTNTHGELGNAGAGTHSMTPVAVSGSTLFTGISAGVSHTCAATGQGPAYCWGENTVGQLGDGTQQSRTAPTIVDAPGQVHFFVTAGAAHSCAIDGDAKVQCWGQNTHGQLGDGTQTTRLRPVSAGSLSPHFRISAGADFTCSLLAGTTVHCWGRNDSGQLGVTAGQPRSTGAAVPGLPPVEYIHAGGHHACARTADGVVYCWGANAAGQLGDGTTTARHTPVRVGS